MQDFTVTLTGLDRRNRLTSRSSSTLHTTDCPTLSRAKALRPAYLNGWMMKDGRPVDHENEWRDDEVGYGRALAYGHEDEQVFGMDTPEVHRAFARLWVEQGKSTCGRCKPETHLTKKEN
jgi:hypothetical protein